MSKMKLINLMLVVVISVVTAASKEISQTKETDSPNFELDIRLPRLVIPQSYDITLQLRENIFDGTSTTFIGQTVIIFTVTQELTEYIYIHAALDVIQISISEFEPNLESVLDPSTSILTIYLEGNTLLPEHEYTMSILYTGELDVTDNLGFYRTSYKNSADLTEYLVATQFQPDYARRAFPCFDEPQYKATFELKILHPVGYLVNSNMRQVNSNEVDESYTLTEFAKTPVMPTYSVAFVVSKLTCFGILANDFVLHEVCSKPGFEGDRPTAVELSKQLKNVLEDITGILFTEILTKFEHIAVPDYVGHSTDNWGLAFYRDNTLLYNANHSSELDKKRVTITVAHQLAQLWFGNLVTHKWWDNLFLTKGFAAYFDYYAPAKLDALAHWELPKQFVVDRQQLALFHDATSTSIVLSTEVLNSATIREKFDPLANYKAASIIKMVEDLVGAETFLTGIRHYLEQHSFDNVEPLELWNVLQVDATEVILQNIPLENIMENWIKMPGYPLVQVSSSGNDILITQKRFLYNGADSTQWYVPVSYTTSNDMNQFQNVTPKLWLVPGNDAFRLSGILESISWIILNNQASGYFRVNYDTNLWHKIRDTLINDHSAVDVLSRTQIVDDVFNLAKSGDLNYTEAIDILSYFIKERDYYPLYTAAVNIDILRKYLGRNSELVNQLNKFELSFLQNLKNLASFTREDTNQIEILRNRLILERLCKLGDADCLLFATTIFKQYVNGISFNNNMKPIVYCYGIRQSENIASDWNLLWFRYLTASVSSEQRTILEALGCIRNEVYLNSYLENSINDDSGIQKQDISTVWNSVINSDHENVDLALNFFIANAERIRVYHTQALSVISIVASRITTNEQLQKLENLLNDVSLHESIKTAIEEALDIVRNTQTWHDVLGPQLEEHLRSPENEEDDPEVKDPDEEDSEKDDGNTGIRNKLMSTSLLVIVLFLFV